MEDKNIKEIFASNLRYYLEKSDKTQAELSRSIKVSTGTVADWCTGRSYPRMDKVERIANLLNIQVSDLIEERSSKHKVYIEKEAIDIVKDIDNNPQNLELYLKIKKLSPQDREIVVNLINNLEGRSK